jgi:pimeloyl-ACP methyl ester carboxylesterase
MKSRSHGKRALPRKHIPPPGWKDPLAPQQPLTSARWILGAVAATLLFAGLCVYGTMCLLFWQGQWQLVFQPSSSVSATPASAGLKYDEIRFDATETGVLQLSGWWIPADPNAPYAANTLLFLHDGSGSLSAALPQLQVLHNLGMNLFAFDYRGFGNSAKTHPSEKSTCDDADAAWHYLTDTRHLAPSTVVIDGIRLGAPIAAETARRHPQAPVLILEDLQPPIIDSLQLDSRMRLLPIRLLFHDRFDPAETLAHLQTPKLMLYPAAVPAARYYAQAVAPKQKVILGAGAGRPLYEDQNYLACLRGFLVKYLPGG